MLYVFQSVSSYLTSLTLFFRIVIKIKVFSSPTSLLLLTFVFDQNQ